MTGNELSRATVRRLDAVRALAALDIIFNHALPSAVPAVGVIVFFLLSGFVIHANEEHRAIAEPGRYLGRRARRLYPVLLAGLAVSVLVAAWDGTLGADFNLVQLLGTLTFQQGVTGPFLHNAPLWSLSYEAVYYLAYPVILLLAPRRRLMVVSAVALVSLALFAASPSHYFLVGTYLLIWWVGAEAARLYRAEPITFLPSMAALGAFGLVAFAGEYLVPEGIRESYSLVPQAFGIALVAMATAVAAPAILRTAFDRVVGWAALLAPISYGLYVIHYPLVSVWKVSDSMLMRLLVSVPLAFALAWIAETALRRGSWLSRTVTFERLRRRSAASAEVPIQLRQSVGNSDTPPTSRQ